MSTRCLAAVRASLSTSPTLLGTAASLISELTKYCEAKCFTRFSAGTNGASVTQEYVTGSVEDKQHELL